MKKTGALSLVLVSGLMPGAGSFGVYPAQRGREMVSTVIKAEAQLPDAGSIPAASKLYNTANTYNSNTAI